MENIIEIKGLSAFYNNNEILKNLNLSIEKGAVFGLIGPNGAGKTTLLKILSGVRLKYEGNLLLFQKAFNKVNRNEILKRLGCLIEYPRYYGHLSAFENLNIVREVYGLKKSRVEEVLQIVALNSVSKKTVDTFSIGMKQRLSIAMAIINRPELLILDEPTNGLDPTGIKDLRILIKKLNELEGVTIVISSHQMEELQKLVTSIGILDKGEIKFSGSLVDFRNNKRQITICIEVNHLDIAKAITILKSKNYSIKSVASNFIYTAIQAEGEKPLMAKFLIENQIQLFSLFTTDENLEDVYNEFIN